MSQLDFWSWVVSEKKKRPKMSYRKMADAGKKRGVMLDPSAIVKAKAHNSKPSHEMIQLIAAAFDMSDAEVEVQAGLKSQVPRDVIENRPLIMQVLENARKLRDAELQTVIALQRALIDQRRRAGITPGPNDLEGATRELKVLYEKACKLTLSQQCDLTKMISGLVDWQPGYDDASPELTELYETARRIPKERLHDFAQMMRIFVHEDV